MHEKSIITLEYPKILARVAKEAAFSASKELVMELVPTPDIDEARRRLAYTTEAYRLLDLHADASVRGAHDIRPLLARAAREGVLLPGDLLQVLETTQSVIHVARVLEKLDLDDFPLLRQLGADMPQRPRIARRIEETISEEGEVLDTASPTLQKLRYDIRGANQRLHDRLRTLVNEFGNALQEHIITIRNDRYVVPVKAESRSQVRGIVHDQSSSGATIYVEPMVVVELNNKLRQLQVEERQEIERILRVLSLEIGREAETLKVAVELLAEFDLHLAKARYGRMTRSTEPCLNNEGRIDLREARHPLLTGRVVPINFHLGREFFMVVITGPNTGGKTVALKTVGLLTLMAQAGLHIPAEEHSEIAVFEEVFADIGDEQSIEQSLSTFSSHMSRIIEILRSIEEEVKSATPEIRGKLSESLVGKQESRQLRALVLLDELGAGTDPSEGSALARAILTYLLEELQAERKAAEDERFHLSMERAEFEYQRKQLEQERHKLEEQRVQILNEARAQARRELDEVQVVLAKIKVDAGGNTISRARLGEARQQVRDLEEKVALLQEPRRSRKRSGVTQEEIASDDNQGPLQIGDIVRVLSFGQNAELLGLSADRSEAEVQMGSMRFRVSVDNIERVSKRQAAAEAGGKSPASKEKAQAQATVVVPRYEDRPEVETQLDMRGWRVEAALDELDTYLNDAAMSGMSSVRILHGKGTGALRAAVRERLAQHPLVKSFTSAPAQEGGDGVTIVKLSA